MQNPPPTRQSKLRVFLIAGFVLFAFLGSYCAREWLSTPQTDITEKSEYQRIIGLSPSIVEIIYQLDLDDRLVGVSKFSNYPPEARQKTIVGGYVDLDYEAVLRLKPDCVILLEEQKPIAEKLEKSGVHTLTVDHASTQGILDSIGEIGRVFHQEKKATAILQVMSQRIQALQKKSPTPPRVLVCISRDTNSNFPDRVIAAGNKGVHQEYITMAGGVNAYQGPVAYPLLSREKLITLDPDIIIELIMEKTWQKKGHATLLRQWQAYGELRAVRHQHIIFLHENKHMIPGPRFVDTLEKFSQAMYP